MTSAAVRNAALLPCPFCGGRPKQAFDNDGRWTQIVCDGCGARSHEEFDTGKVVASWNTRALQSHEAPAAEPEYIYDDERFNKGVQHVVDMLARNLDVSDWVAGDGSENYDEDLWQTILNILSAKGLYDRDTGTFAAPAGADWRVPDGFKLVPVEPTQAMIIRGKDAARAVHEMPIHGTEARACYRAMLDAAPAQKQEPGK